MTRPPRSTKVNRFEVFWVNLDPTVGSEIQKTRPAVVISPDAMNHNIGTVIIAPMTSSGKVYPTRVECDFDGKKALIVLDQIRTVDKSRLVQPMGKIDEKTQAKVLHVLTEMFAR